MKLRTDIRKLAHEQLDEWGVNGAAADLLLSVTGQQRHQYRVCQALRVALATSLGLSDWSEVEVESHREEGFDFYEVSMSPPLSEEEWGAPDSPPDKPFPDPNPVSLMHVRARAWAVLAADLIGVGGTGGVTGDGTKRIPALEVLGKGRKQATDGPSWSAAIGAAKAAIEYGVRFLVGPRSWQEQPPMAFRFEPSGGKLAVCPRQKDLLATLSKQGDLGPLRDLQAHCEDILPAAWVRSVAGRALMTGAVRRTEMDDRFFVLHDDDLEYYAEIFNRVDELRAAMRRAELAWLREMGNEGSDKIQEDYNQACSRYWRLPSLAEESPEAEDSSEADEPAVTPAAETLGMPARIPEVETDSESVH